MSEDKFTLKRFREVFPSCIRIEQLINSHGDPDIRLWFSERDYLTLDSDYTMPDGTIATVRDVLAKGDSDGK